jgi:hypothetical protein
MCVCVCVAPDDGPSLQVSIEYRQPDSVRFSSSTAALVFLSAMDDAAVVLPLAAPFKHDAESCSQPVPQLPGIEKQSGFPLHIAVTTLTELPRSSTATTVHTESLPITPPKTGLSVVTLLAAQGQGLQPAVQQPDLAVGCKSC